MDYFDSRTRRFRIIILLVLNLTISLLLVSSANSSEVDQETYASIPLNDSSAEINRQINLKVQSIIDDINTSLKHKAPQNLTDSELEYQFASAWKERLPSPWTSDFEECIPNNACPGWNKIDRINLQDGESIYDEADFNVITTRYVTSVINVCGIRFGVDKLTHMFQDGFRFYDLWMNESTHLTDDEIFNMSLEEERHIMGRTLTDVISYGDVYANLAGVKLFRSLFMENRILQRDQEGLLRLKQPLNICNYVNSQFDERNSPIEYFGEKALLLKQIIEKRRHSGPMSWSQQEINEILSRPQTRSVGFVEIAVGIWELLSHPEMTSAIEPHFPKTLTAPQYRKSVTLEHLRPH